MFDWQFSIGKIHFPGVLSRFWPLINASRLSLRRKTGPTYFCRTGTGTLDHRTMMPRAQKPAIEAENGYWRHHPGSAEQANRMLPLGAYLCSPRVCLLLGNTDRVCFSRWLTPAPPLATGCKSS
ncbi:hypothetical protein CY34DRAFT_802753 [Suillus luteus UH-Slu-Lm8-n1]|uniref:Uncharacterized protein n=1 Tax=Suillus luteus UH-Slu-Lm8-n1 TaxID=930992 RepID=A0A0D0BM23_9AGAM|nr:hypothetical protein CY34DRAFT_802753 [Suillus luteus UH-Slu-Lm8-n1]